LIATAALLRRGVIEREGMVIAEGRTKPRTALRDFDGVGGLKAWLAGQLWRMEPDGWTVSLDLVGWRLRPVPTGLWVSATPPSGGAPAV
jgi:hypothetical protein